MNFSYSGKVVKKEILHCGRNLGLLLFHFPSANISQLFYNYTKVKSCHSSPLSSSDSCPSSKIDLEFAL